MDASTQSRASDSAERQQPTSQPAQSPQVAEDPLQAILQRASAGDRSVLPLLKKVLDENPRIWADCYKATALVEQGWLDRIAASNLLLGQSIRRQVEALKKDLGAESCSALQKILIDRIAACWLGVQFAELTLATDDTGASRLAQAKRQCLESANKRLLAASKTLAVVRRLSKGLRIEINHTQTPPAVPAQPVDADGPIGEVVHDRLRGMLAGSHAGERAMM